MEKTVCELFAGVGGFRVGLEASSKEWITVFGNQWEPSKKIQHAFNCYKAHFEESGGVTEYSNVDIAKVPGKEIPNHTLLVGGFPCQDYSVASTGAEGIQGKKGVLWWEIERILEEKSPAFVLLENVDRLLKSPSKQRGRDFGVMLACFNKLGYSVEWRVINAAEYGFQQRRRRIFIFAAKNNTDYYNSLNDDYEEVLTNTGFFGDIFPIENHITHYTELSESILEVSDNFSFNFENNGFMKNRRIYTNKSFPTKLLRKQILLEDIVEKGEVDEKFFLNEKELEDWKYLKGAKRINRTSKTGHSYVFSEGAIAFPDPLDRPGRTMLTSERSKNRSTHIIEDLFTKRLRKLTPVECERLNGFPDNWTKLGGMSESFRYFCMGNALVVNLIEIMGKKIEKLIDKENKES